MSVGKLEANITAVGTFDLVFQVKKKSDGNHCSIIIIVDCISTPIKFMLYIMTAAAAWSTGWYDSPTVACSSLIADESTLKSDKNIS